MWRSIQQHPRTAAGVALAAIITAYVAIMLAWIAVDGSPTRGVCCGLSHSAFELIRATASAEVGLPQPPWSIDRGWFPWVTWAVWQSKPSADALLWTVLGFTVLAQLFAYDAARSIAGRGAGLLAAGLLPLAPVMAFAARRYDVHAPQAALVLAATALALRSGGLTRPLPTCGLALIGAAAGFFSPRETDNFLLLLGVGGAVAGAWLPAVVAGRAPDGRDAKRLRALIGGLVVLAATGAALHWGLKFTSEEGVGYYFRESGHDTSADALSWTHPRMLSAYAAHLYWRGLTPWLALPGIAAALAWAMGCRGRAVIIGQLLLPAAILTFLPKKNYYYLAMVWPVLPVLAAAGAAKARPLALRAVLVLGLLLPATTQWLARSWPSRAPAPLTSMHWQAGDPTWGGIMQTSDGKLNLAPKRSTDASTIAQQIKVSIDACRCPYQVRAEGSGPWNDVWAELVVRSPCVRLRDGPGGEGMTGVILREVRSGGPTRSAPPTGFTLTARAFTDAGHTVQIWQRPPGWFEGQCRTGD